MSARLRFADGPDLLLLLCAALVVAPTGCGQAAPPSGEERSREVRTPKVLPHKTPIKVAKNEPPPPPVDTLASPAPPPKSGPADSTPTVPTPAPGAKTEDERNTIDVFRAAAPATVFVKQSRVVVDRWQLAEIPTGAGTGFVWDNQGHIVTNCHVVLPGCDPRRASSLKVTLYNQDTHSAELVGIDRTKDIAVLRIEAKSGALTPIARPPKGYTIEVGQKTIAIGNPFGLDHTLTTGVVSALGREVMGIGKVNIRDMIQTDAAINPGNSGGPLLDSAGRLIGMNTMIFSQSGSSAGIGFAVPYQTIARIVPQLIRTGHPERVGLGITIVPDEIKRRALGAIDGVVVGEVPRNSDAAKAGLRSVSDAGNRPAFDLIIAVDDQAVRDYNDLYNAIDGKSEGDEVTVKIRRFPEDRVFTAPVRLRKL